MKRILASLLALHLAIPQLKADKITLQDGTVLTARILEDRGETLLLEVNVTESIKDQREIPREQIKSVVETPPDAERFVYIQELVPTPDLLNATDYEGRLQQLSKFEEAFPESGKLDKVAEMRKELEAEAAKVAEGSLKLNGIWVSVENQESNAYDFKAALMLRDIKKAAQENRLRDAALIYDEMQEEVPNSSHQQEAQKIIKQVYNLYLNIVMEQKAEAEDLIAKRQESLSNLEAEVREKVEAELVREDLAFQTAYDRAKASGTRWVPSSPYQPRALQEVSRQISASIKKLADQETRLEENAGQLFAAAWDASEEGKDADTADDAYDEFKSAEPSDFYENIIERRVEMLEEAEDAEKERLKEEERAAKEAERAAREAERNAPKEKPVPAKVEAPKASKAITTSEAETKKPKSTPPPAAEDEITDDEGSGIPMVSLMAGLGLVVILLVVFLAKQKNKK